jgi:hypothetical protein
MIYKVFTVKFDIEGKKLREYKGAFTDLMGAAFYCGRLYEHSCHGEMTNESENEILFSF